ncbi:MAG: cation diffusion facilitator family transporter [Dysgonomonas sp.]|nr:cation diffusion facilitator family transporter [Dysgonomonas sp.]
MYKAVFKIDKMDCPCEENLIRLKLESMDNIIHQEYDLTNRKLTIVHANDIKLIESAIAELDLGSTLLENTETEYTKQENEDKKQRKALWAVLIINFAFFVIEMATGIISKSMGLVADSLDMLADAFVYTLSLFAVGAVIARKKKVALISGYFQILLALLGFIEVIKRFIGIEEVPHFQTMIVISILALIANTACLLILQRTKSKDAHIQASLIFSSNDVIINAGVILAGLTVWWLNSNIPDLVIGSIVFAIVIRGALRILKLAKN